MYMHVIFAPLPKVDASPIQKQICASHLPCSTVKALGVKLGQNRIPQNGDDKDVSRTTGGVSSVIIFYHVNLFVKQISILARCHKGALIRNGQMFKS